MMKTKRIGSLGCACLAFLLLAGTAKTETIRELVTIQGAPSITLEGVGIITGLANTGDKAKAALSLLKKFLDNMNLNFDESSLAVGNIALVRVTAEMPPFSRPGNKYPAIVTSIADAKSLEGGFLLACDLFDGNKLVARASGQVSVGEGQLTSGRIFAGQNGGALQLDVYDFGKIVDEEGIVRLNLNRANWADAAAIARQINQTPSLNPYLQETSMFAEAEPTRPVAFAKDMGQVLVRIPEQYQTMSAVYIHEILKVPVAVDRPATIVVNRARGSIVVTGDVQINKNAMVSLQDKMVTLTPPTPDAPARYTLEDATPRNAIEIHGPGTYADLQSLIDTLNAMGLTTQQIITIFEQLRTSGAINAEFITE